MEHSRDSVVEVLQMMLRKLISVSLAITGTVVLIGCAAKETPTGGAGTTNANAGGGPKPGGANAAMLYSSTEVETIKKGIQAFQAYVRKDRIDPNGKEYNKEGVARAKDLADTYCENLLKLGDQGFNRAFPTAKAEDQGRWIFEKETIAAGLSMLGEEGRALRGKVVAQHGNVVGPIKADKAKADAIQKAWRFRIKWSL